MIFNKIFNIFKRNKKDDEEFFNKNFVNEENFEEELYNNTNESISGKILRCLKILIIMIICISINNLMIFKIINPNGHMEIINDEEKSINEFNLNYKNDKYHKYYVMYDDKIHYIDIDLNYNLNYSNNEDTLFEIKKYDIENFYNSDLNYFNDLYVKDLIINDVLCTINDNLNTYEDSFDYEKMSVLSTIPLNKYLNQTYGINLLNIKIKEPSNLLLNNDRLNILENKIDNIENSIDKLIINVNKIKRK